MSVTWDRLGARSEEEAYACHVQRFRRDVGIAVAREFARYRLLRVPFVGVPRAVIRDRHAGRREARAVPAQGPMQADFFRHRVMTPCSHTTHSESPHSVCLACIHSQLSPSEYDSASYTTI